MIKSAKYGLQICDVFFDEPVPKMGMDLCRYHFYSEPIQEAQYVGPYSTVVVDLTRDPKVLMADMAKTGRYEIRRAESEDLTIYENHGSDAAAIDRFLEFFRTFSKIKGTAMADVRWLSAYAANHALVITSIREKGGAELVWHVHMHSGGNARLLYSASAYVESGDASRRAFIGRANRYHHWLDFLMFREIGAVTYDLGGVCEPEEEDRALQGIRQFKTSLGGTVVSRFDCTEVTSARAKMAMWVWQKLKRQRIPGGA